ncbi:hypothetical protein BS17DRAFT_772375 [Gyrodon lividus]|nr:hypothetical protein BS17DRAFT_772375 [Gyrodon lividus]
MHSWPGVRGPPSLHSPWPGPHFPERATLILTNSFIPANLPRRLAHLTCDAFCLG